MVHDGDASISTICPVSPRGSMVTNYASQRDRLYCCRTGSLEHWNERSKPEGEVIGRFEDNEVAFVEGEVDEWLKIAGRGWVKKEHPGGGWFQLEVERHKIPKTMQTCRGIQLLDKQSQLLMAIEAGKNRSLLLKLQTCTHTVTDVVFDNKRTFTFNPVLKVTVDWEFLMKFVIVLKKLCQCLDDLEYLETPTNITEKGVVHQGVLFCDSVEIQMLSTSERQTAEGLQHHSSDEHNIRTPNDSHVDGAIIDRKTSRHDASTDPVEGSEPDASLEGTKTVVLLQNPPPIRKKQKPISPVGDKPHGTNDIVIDVRFRRRLMNMYQFYRPEKLPSVMPTVMGNFGDPEDIIAALVKKYGPEPRDIMADQLRPGWQQVETTEGDMFYCHSSGAKQWVRPTEYLNDSSVNPEGSVRPKRSRR
eukprot:TRINITY_DN4809_c0_g1_i1.p1 TRINITY_DN4809_c0_g1~~TRINITY_DN4809_c0_g1_i1.p1  ORF type:complete len:417 (+),score=82.30 TRINITY_DN4809_c0_g1_i1:88-1338(+)